MKKSNAEAATNGSNAISRGTIRLYRHQNSTRTFNNEGGSFKQDPSPEDLRIKCSGCNQPNHRELVRQAKNLMNLAQEECGKYEIEENQAQSNEKNLKQQAEEARQEKLFFKNKKKILKKAIRLLERTIRLWDRATWLIESVDSSLLS